MCPLCRATIICQMMDENSELGRLRRSLFELRSGRTRGSSEERPQPSAEFRRRLERQEISSERAVQRSENQDENLTELLLILPRDAHAELSAHELADFVRANQAINGREDFDDLGPSPGVVPLRDPIAADL